MKKLVCLLLLLLGCNQDASLVITPAPHRFGTGKNLTIVVPQYWSFSSVNPYVNLKANKGFVVTVIHSNSDPDALRQSIADTHPNYVFLVGDFSLIPAVFRCSPDNDPGTPFAKACIYSDYWLSDKPIGRLMISNQSQLNNYVIKAKIYEGRMDRGGTYIINDRNYPYSDDVAQGWKLRLENHGIEVRNDVVGVWANPYLNDGAGVASGISIGASIDQGIDFIQYYGHGSATQWEDVNYLSVSPHLGSVTPFIFSIGCETALMAPNPPWYEYVDVNGNLISFDLTNGMFYTADMIPDPAPIQPEYVLMNSWAKLMTSDNEWGPMVYLGETVVTSPEPALQNAFYDQLILSYQTPMAIGDIWYNAIDNASGHPEYFQIVGDPSTEYAVIF